MHIWYILYFVEYCSLLQFLLVHFPLGILMKLYTFSAIWLLYAIKYTAFHTITFFYLDYL